jgi:cytidylate kinase
MSIVALSTSVGSLGDEIGREAARALRYEFADREIIARAADRFGSETRDLRHVAEEKPTLWERVSDTKRHFIAYVEAIVLEMAARDNVVLAGLSAAIVLRGIPHALRVRVTGPERARAARVQHQQGLTDEAAVDVVREADRERATRIRFLYHADWDDPALYDLVVNTERMTVATGARLVVETLKDERFQATPDSLGHASDLAIVALAKASLLANPATHTLHLSLECRRGTLSAGGLAGTESARKLAVEILQGIPGVTDLRNEIVVTPTRSYAPAP